VTITGTTVTGNGGAMTTTTTGAGAADKDRRQRPETEKGRDDSRPFSLPVQASRRQQGYRRQNCIPAASTAPRS
jgi:hypothetical protein